MNLIFPNIGCQILGYKQQQTQTKKLMMKYYRSCVMTEGVATWHKMNCWYDGLCVSVVRTEMFLHPSVSKIIYISCSASSSFTPPAQPRFTALNVSHLTTKAWAAMIHAAHSNSLCECLKDEYEAPIMQLFPPASDRVFGAVVGRVRLDSWSLSGLVGGFLQTPLQPRDTRRCSQVATG